MSVAKALNIDDLRRMARKRLPRMVFDYIDGGADDEATLAANTQRFRDRQLTYNTLVDVSSINTCVSVLGMDLPLPFILAPTAAQRLFHPRHGELASARAAAHSGVAYSVSTVATQTVETIAEAYPGPKLFQVYVWRDRSLVEHVLERAKAAGYRALVLTVDLPVVGNRERDPRNGFTIPVKLTAQTLSQVAAKPRYLYELWRGGPAKPANFEGLGDRDVLARTHNQFDPSVTWEYLSWLRKVWDGPLAIKGLSRADDAETALKAGVDAVWISNHGGRQLDTAPASIDTLSPIAAAVKGRAQIILDGGIRRGTDIIKALALGADAVAVGRPYLYGLAAGGEAGVARAVEILKTETERTLALVGRPDIASLTPDLIFNASPSP